MITAFKISAGRKNKNPQTNAFVTPMDRASTQVPVIKTINWVVNILTSTLKKLLSHVLAVSMYAIRKNPAIYPIVSVIPKPLCIVLYNAKSASPFSMGFLGKKKQSNGRTSVCKVKGTG